MSPNGLLVTDLIVGLLKESGYSSVTGHSSEYLYETYCN